MKIGSLFSGIGGLECGLEIAGLGSVVWQVEIDEFCRRVLAKHWPQAKRYEDVRKVGKENLSQVDLICGGFPCQNLSSAGKQEGLSGEKSGLWFEYRRIIDELRPKLVVIENVASGKRLWLPAVRQHLYVLGYDSTAIAVSAAAVGAPHVRKRIFVIARPADSDGPRWSWSDGSKLAIWVSRKRDAGYTNEGRESTGAIDDEMARVCGLARGSWPWTALPRIRRVDDGVSRGMDERRIKSLGNAVVPQCAEVVGRMIVDALEMKAAA